MVLQSSKQSCNRYEIVIITLTSGITILLSNYIDYFKWRYNGKILLHTEDLAMERSEHLLADVHAKKRFLNGLDLRVSRNSNLSPQPQSQSREANFTRSAAFLHGNEYLKSYK